MKSLATNVIVRVGMIGCWVVLIFSFLFFPYVSRLIYEEKNLSLFIWPMILDAKVLAQFEKETGIKVYVNYYESNEELYSKLKATQGKGYDIIVPTDYMVEYLIHDELIKKIDHSKLHFLDRLQPFLRGNYYDPQQAYSVPYYMSVYGLGINKDYFGGVEPEPTWALAFDQQYIVDRIAMIDNPREAIMIAALYLYGSINKLSDAEKLHAVEQLLIKQKSWVETYTSARIEELLASGSCPVAVGTSTDIWKASREYSNIKFVLPREGSFVTVDSFVLPKTTTKDAMIYQLINFLYRHDVLKHNCTKHGFCPPTTDVVVDGYDVVCPDSQQFQKLDFFRNVLTRTQIQNIWISVKAH